MDVQKRHFQNRLDAGRCLAQSLVSYRDHSNLLVLGLPPGGVPVAYEIATYLGAPLDIFVSRLVASPNGRGIAGVATSGGVYVADSRHPLPPEPEQVLLAANIAEELHEIARREQRWRGSVVPVSIKGKTTILVDDGLAPHELFHLTLKAVRSHYPSSLIAAIPMASEQTMAEWAADADEVVCALPLEPLFELGTWYRDFSHFVTDREIQQSLKGQRKRLRAA